MKESLHEENMQAEEGLSLIEIVRLLLRKIKLLFIVVCIGGILGGTFGLWKTIDMKYYGTTVEFYVNPEKPSDLGSSSNSAANSTSQYGVYGAYGRHVMDAIVKLLGSESFTEQLMLEEDGLPSTKIYPNLNETKYTNAVNAKKATTAAWATAATFDQPRAMALDYLEQCWDAAGQVGSFSETAYKKLLDAGTAPDFLKVAYEDFVKKDNERNDALEDASKAQKENDKVVEILLDEWRGTSTYAYNLARYQEAVSYSYLGKDEDIDDANNLARSFIYVSISVLNDEEFAIDALERVKKTVPEYIEQNMIVPTDYEGTSCTRITRTDGIRRTNPNYRRNQTIKYAFLAAVAAGVIASVLIIILDAQDKRLRDHEIITRKLKVPVLGIIPTIEEMNQALDAKNKQQRRGN